MSDISIYELKKTNLRGATVIDGFPSIGLVSSIVANYLVNALELEQIGIMDSNFFPSISLIRNAQPLNTVRIYASERVRGTDEEDVDQIVVFISEFQPPPNLIKPISAAILDWIQEQRCSMLISPEGLVIERPEEDIPLEEEEAEEPKEEDNDIESKIKNLELFGVGSTPGARNLLDEHDISPFIEGVITGVAGVLLNEGKRRDFDVISLLAEAHSNYPDARAAARIIEVLDRLVLNIHIDSKPLYKEAEAIEMQIKSIRSQAKTSKVMKAPPSPRMYG
ncbi:MAG: proteasome assembly chaperone family protein [Thermoplasmata archaeon]|nr:MAG: proteasome assembly chaperone family protein [Thermoplasmata archaeon]